jgi:hypothetical protein
MTEQWRIGSGYFSTFGGQRIMVNENVSGVAPFMAALLRLGRHDPRTASVSGPATVAGFTPASDRDYDQHHRAARLVGAL